MGKKTKGKRVLGPDNDTQKVRNEEDIDIDNPTQKQDSEEDSEGEGSSKASRVMKISNIPYGFFEKEIKTYFGQFGIVTKVKLCRSESTNACRGWGWVEFAYPQVAKIAAQAMDGYMMFGKTLRCEIMAKGKIPFNLFKGHSRRIVVRNPVIRLANKVNRPLKSQEKMNLIKKEIQKDRERSERILQLGIEYEYTPLEELFKRKQELRQKLQNELSISNKAMIKEDNKRIKQIKKLGIDYTYTSFEDLIKMKQKQKQLEMNVPQSMMIELQGQ